MRGQRKFLEIKKTEDIFYFYLDEHLNLDEY